MLEKTFSVLAAVTLGAAMVVAQDPQAHAPRPPQPSPSPSPSMSQSQSDRDQSVTGCLIQGSGPTVFLLENAKMSSEVSAAAGAGQERAGAGQSAASAGRTYLVAAASSVDLKGQLNHQVTLTGTGETKASPTAAPGAKIDEKDLPKFSAKSVVKIADTCPTTAG